MKKIGIIGSRRRDTEKDYKLVEEQFCKIYNMGDTIVSGGCPKGGDRFAELIAKRTGVSIKIFPADWEKYGRGAGFIRNTDIARESDILIACVSQDRTGGTEDTIRKFLKDKDKKYLYLV
jgi:cysteine synthase